MFKNEQIKTKKNRNKIKVEISKKKRVNYYKNMQELKQQQADFY